MSIHKPKIAKISQNPGVYIFKDKIGHILYVGKATNLRSRVSSYFSGKRGSDRPIETLIHQVADIAVQETESVLEALILEANLIKKYQPKYNVLGRDDKSFSYFVITKEEFPRVLILRETELGADKKLGVQRERRTKDTKFQYAKTYGPYTSKKQMEIALKIIRKIFPFHSLPGKTEKGCLDFQLGLCPGPYAGAISKKDYAKNILGIRMILEGKKKSLLRGLKKEMETYADRHEFERANEIKHKIFALNHVQDVALISESLPNPPLGKGRELRIEAYDISNISGQHAVGSMVVFNQDKPDKSQYRKFKIKTIEGSDDVGMMREVLLRRLKNAWTQPDLIMLDGGKGHLNMAQKLLLDLGLVIPTVAVAKGASRKNLKLITHNLKPDLQKVLNDKNLIKRIMDEAHRFAIGYHCKLRRKNLLP